MNVLSLFDGMSCGRLALDKAKIKYRNYYAAEVDKYAIKVSQANYPDTIQLGDVTKWREWDIDWSSVGLLLGGSPCQGFSFAGKQLAFNDPRSALFFVYVDILNHIKKHNPDVKFLLENVRMKKEYLDVISEHLGVEPVMINSALVSAQNRVRFYWCNWEVNQPDDKGILLKDIIEQAETDRDKAHCIDANHHKGATWEQYKTKHRRQQVLYNQYESDRDKSQTILSTIYKENVKSMIKRNKKGLYLKKSLCNQVGIASDIRGNESIKRIYGTDGKCPCLTTMGGGHREPKIARMTGRKINPNTGKRDDYNPNLKAEQRLEPRTDNKSGCLTTVQKDNLLMLDKTQYRKLTPLECERLQTVPDNYTNHVSNTQRYKMLGNGWTVDVIAHIFKEYFSA